MIPYIVAALGGYLIANASKRTKFTDGGSVLLAPNGKPSNLTPEQYRLVRTPAFKEWFGFWENDPANASKVLDENGEPKILFHGTDFKWNVFDFNKVGEGSDFLGKGIYLTENYGVANFYANQIAKKRFIVGYEEGIFGSKIPVYDKNAEEKAKEFEVVFYFFVNAKNILFIDKAEIDEKVREILLSALFDIFGDMNYAIRSLNNTLDFIKTDSDKIRNYRGELIYLMEQYPDAKNEIIKYLKSKYDCFVFTPSYEFEKSSENYMNYVVFNSEQIKLADGSNTTFDAENPDVRFEQGGKLKNVNKNGGVITLLKNKTKAPRMGMVYGQDVEPAGYYAIEKKTNIFDDIPQYETVHVTYSNPLIIDVKPDNLVSWKYELSRKYKAKGNRLTEKLKKEGYDIIITRYPEGDYGEIIVLDTNKIQRYDDGGQLGDVNQSNYFNTTTAEFEGINVKDAIQILDEYKKWRRSKNKGTIYSPKYGTLTVDYESERKNAFFESRSLSYYFVSENRDFVIRISDHWSKSKELKSRKLNCGYIRSCFWTNYGQAFRYEMAGQKYASIFIAGICYFKDFRRI